MSRNKRSTRSNKRPEIITVVCFSEGKTEANYLQFFIKKINQGFNKRKFDFYNAKSSVSSKSNIKNIEKLVDGYEFSNNQIAIVLLDTDRTDDHQNIKNFFDKRKIFTGCKEYMFVVSSPRIETWILLHYQKGPFSPQKIKSDLKDNGYDEKADKNNHSRINSLMEHTTTACENAKNLCSSHELEATKNNISFEKYIVDNTNLALTNFHKAIYLLENKC